MGGAVAVVGIGVVKAAGVAKNHEADAEEHCQQWEELGKGDPV